MRFEEYHEAYGQTPLSIKEDIPWRYRRLVIGTGADGALPMMAEVEQEAKRRRLTLLSCPPLRRSAC